MLSNKSIFTFILSAMLLAGFTQADDQILTNVYNISISENSSVANDQMRVVFSASSESTESSIAANEVNKQMAWAVAQAKKLKGAEVQTLNYQTRPVYQNQKIRAWRVNQQLQITSSDFDAVSKLTAQLQEKLMVSSMNFLVSDNLKKQEQDKLIVTGLEQFKQRAELIQKTMGANSYTILSANLNTDQGYMSGPVMLESRAMSMKAESATIESGNSKVNISIDGRIQLEF